MVRPGLRSRAWRPSIRPARLGDESDEKTSTLRADCLAGGYRQGAGFDRVRAFREGVINGAESCLSYQN